MTSVQDAHERAPSGKTHRHRSEVRDGMRIDWDVPIKMDAGLRLRADVFRPVKDGRYPVILSYGPYGKSLAAARLCLCARGFPRRRLLAGNHRPLLAARDQGLLRLYRMGGRAALV